MKRELLLLRHGKSDWSHPVDDLHRPLKKRGREAAAQIGRWMRQQGIVPEQIISSPAVRALETTRIVAGKLGLPEEMIAVEPEIYEAHWRELLTIVRGLPKKRKRVMLVGHNTSMEELLLYLASGALRPGINGKLFPTAALARFVFQGSWSSLQPQQVFKCELIRPRELDAK